jgi:ppGpp synthetase/RelA/SpoT-type nucleotidyltranferase
LGDRLRKGDIDDDLRLLDAYRRSFTESYEFVIDKIRQDLRLVPTGRPAKSTSSIIDKLNRESIRLSQIQDIAGCRILVSDLIEQDTVVAKLANLFDSISVVDRRTKSSHGYRAVHVIVSHSGQLIELQIRTRLQHLWAELSEKLSDVVDNSLKYGGGGTENLVFLTFTSEAIQTLEDSEKYLTQLKIKGVTNEETRILETRIPRSRKVILELLADLDPTSSEL